MYLLFSRSPCTPFRLLRAIRHLFWPPHISSLTKSANHRQISYRRSTYIALHLKVVLHWIANSICMFSSFMEGRRQKLIDSKFAQQGRPIEDYQYLHYCSVSLRAEVCMWTCVYVCISARSSYPISITKVPLSGAQVKPFLRLPTLGRFFCTKTSHYSQCSSSTSSAGSRLSGASHCSSKS